jgi:transcriptional regulator with XRE-family HTH domain
MARKFETLRRSMGEERQERNRERAAAMLVAMDLAALRGSLNITQEELAARLAISQSNVSRMERRQDMLLSTLRQVVAALGGELRVSAVFPEGTVELARFE